MRLLYAASSLTPILLLANAATVYAETVISTERTTPIKTSTVNGGNPDSVKISTTGTVKVSSGTAVHMDSNHGVKNEGKITITGANNATGILADPGVSGTINNTGTITIDEDYTPTDTDNDGDLDGSFAQGSGRFGIRIAPGGTFTGDILNSGTITIEGNDSAGISIESSLAGSLNSTGKVSITGDRSYGIRANDVSGNVTIKGLVEVKGKDSVGVALDGNIGGALVFGGTITATGYRSINPSDPSKLDADDILQGGPAVRIQGNVAKGILFDTGSAIIVFGAAPAVQIGSASNDITIGAVTTAGDGLVVKGAIGSNAVLEGIASKALVIGGLGGAVSLTGGMTVSGSVTAIANKASATAIHIGSETTVPDLEVSGKVAAAGGGTSTSSINAIVIDQGASLTSLRNSGQITAVIDGSAATGAAIVDKSGTLSFIENKGAISLVGTGYAIDLRANTAGAIIRQAVPAQGAAAPIINGNIAFGSGNDTFEVQAGSINGNTNFGAGSDTLILVGNSIYTGSASFGDDGTDVLGIGNTAIFRGALSGSNNLAVNVASGSLDLTNTGTVSLASLNVGDKGSFTVNIDGVAGTHTLYQVAGTANFAQGAKVNVHLNSIGNAAGTYVIVDAGTLTGGSNLTATGLSIPVLFASTLSQDMNAGTVTLTIRRKTSTELGLNLSQSSAIDAILVALDEDQQFASAFLAVDDTSELQSLLHQMLPEHAGGTFETVTQASRATARFLSDHSAPVIDMGGWGMYLQQVAWGTSKDLGNTAAYDLAGWGASGGAEYSIPQMGKFGFGVSYLLGKDANGETDSEIDTSQIEVSGYWRNSWGGLHAFARVSAAQIKFDSVRRFGASTGTGSISRESEAQWDGKLYSAAFGLSYEARAGRLILRPAVSADFYRLKEDGYTETGGGPAMDLIVDARESDEKAANASLAIGYDIMRGRENGSFLRFEAEGGRRHLFSSTLGATRARFAGGEDFLLNAEERTSGWLGRLRVMGGDKGFLVAAEANAEEQHDRAAISFRGSLHFAF